MNERKIEFELIKKIIETNIKNASCGLYDTRNTVGDTMETLYTGKYYQLDICYDYGYFEIFGITSSEEYNELQEFYKKLGGE
jgi:hypothetical protein